MAVVRKPDPSPQNAALYICAYGFSKGIFSLLFSQQGMYLRDVLDDLNRRKLRDVLDFEWKRNIRFYGSDNSRAPGELTRTRYRVRVMFKPGS